jgi:formamidopyrimidine-DNA glycosylase
MFELPEMLTLADQMNETIKGKEIRKGMLGNSPHKFVWYNRKPPEFGKLTRSKQVGNAYAKGNWMFIPLEPGYVLVIGEFGGKVLFHEPGSKIPKKYHLCITFTDNSFVTACTQMWGAVELYEKGKEHSGKYVKNMKPTPVDKGFTYTYFKKLITGIKEKKSTKGLLTQDQLIPGIGNAITQDILFKAKLHPRHPLSDLTEKQQRKLYDAMIHTVKAVIHEGGRYDEYDLYGNKGGYKRLMDRNAAGKPCPQCRRKIQKIQYLGGACYVCPGCQIWHNKQTTANID